MKHTRESLINRILYWGYKYWIRDMVLEWEGRIFDPKTKEDQNFLENADIETLEKIMNKYLENRGIVEKHSDDFVYRQRMKKTRTKT
jgi:hypothetical protein